MKTASRVLGAVGSALLIYPASSIAMFGLLTGEMFLFIPGLLGIAAAFSCFFFSLLADSVRIRRLLMVCTVLIDIASSCVLIILLNSAELLPFLIMFAPCPFLIISAVLIKPKENAAR